MLTGCEFFLLREAILLPWIPRWCPESEIRANSEMEGVDRSGDMFKILESRIVVKMGWQRQYFINLCAILVAGSHIMRGSALRFLRYPLAVLADMMRRKYASEFVTQNTREEEVRLN